MPIPQPEKNEEKKKFVARCMSSDVMVKDYPDNKQRIAICLGQTSKKSDAASILEDVCEAIEYIKILEDLELGFTEEVTAENFYNPKEEDYEDIGYPIEDIEEFDLIFSKFEYRDPVTNELYYYDRRGIHTKDGRQLIYIGKGSEYQGRKVQLNKPFRTPNGPKKSSVYVKNDKGNVVKVNFGDPNMKIKKNIPERRKSFRARHNCDNPGPKWKARYWSCRAW
jgi:hypothetical protein